MSTSHPEPTQQPEPQRQAPQQPVPQQPQLPPAPEKRKSWFARHKVLTGIGAIVLVSIIGANMGGGGDDSAGSGVAEADAATAQDDVAEDDVAQDTAAEDAAAEADEASAKEEQPEKLPAVGDTVRDGKFEFTVTKIEDGVQEIGNEFLSEKAQGQFVLVHMTVENIGDEAQYFDGDSQELVDTEGRTHSADTAAAIYLDDSNSFLNEINPGNAVDGIVVFDLPKQATPASLELHDSMFSGGVQVALT